MMESIKPENFWRHVEKRGPRDCWLWTGSTNRGYGRYKWLRGKTTAIYAHRVAYELLMGPIPEGLFLDHLCRTPLCVNPAHLSIVDHRTNVLRGNGPTAMNAMKTECVNGHPFDQANTLATSSGARRCRECHNASARRRRERQMLNRTGKHACVCGASFETPMGLRVHVARRHPVDQNMPSDALYGPLSHQQSAPAVGGSPTPNAPARRTGGEGR